MKAAIAVVCRVLHELFAEPKHSCYAEQDKKEHMFTNKRTEKETEVSTINSANIQYTHQTYA